MTTRFIVIIASVISFTLGIIVTTLFIHPLSILRLPSRATTKTVHHQISNAVSDTGITHLAIIMDGNRRWAKEKHQPTRYGHTAGIEPAKKAIQFCLENNIPYLSLYAFSLENFKRSPQELHFLFNTLATGLASSEMQQLLDQDVQVHFLGDRSCFPDHLRATIDDIEQKTASGKKLTLSLLFCYGGQQDISHACQKIAQATADLQLDPAAITPELIRQHLWTNILPPPDIIVRTGKVQRLSNFFTFDSAYSELLFLDRYWPEVTIDDFIAIAEEFKSRQRRFGS